MTRQESMKATEEVLEFSGAYGSNNNNKSSKEVLIEVCPECQEAIDFRDILTTDSWQLDSINYYTCKCPECDYDAITFKVECHEQEDN